jgi:hypothetical protein
VAGTERERDEDERGGLVEEEKKLRLRGELDSDGDTLASLDVESETGETNHSVGLVLELKKLDNLLDLFGEKSQRWRKKERE